MGSFVQVVAFFECFEESLPIFKAGCVAGEGADVELNFFELGQLIDQAAGFFNQDIEGSEFLIKCDHNGMTFDLFVFVQQD